jgi:CheY-like chemotaxis protein
MTWQVATSHNNRPTVMVVDDDDAVRVIVRAVLEDEGYRVLIAESGSLGLEMLAGVTPSLILLDYMMPEMNGSEFLRALRQRGLCRSTPILLLTAVGRIEEQVNQLDVQGIIQKPFELEELITTVKQWIGARQETGQTSL